MATAFCAADVLNGFGYATQKSASTVTAIIVEVGSLPFYSYLEDWLIYLIGLRINIIFKHIQIALFEDRNSNKYSFPAPRDKHALQEPRIRINTVKLIYKAFSHHKFVT